MTPLLYDQLLRRAFAGPAETTRYLSGPTLGAYAAFEHAPAAEVAFRFERVRLAVGLALLKLLADLGDHAESRAVQELLHRALRAGSAPEIDAIIAKDAKLFDRLYSNLYVNEEGEQLLNLFGQVLDADSEESMDRVIIEAHALAQELDFSHLDEEE